MANHEEELIELVDGLRDKVLGIDATLAAAHDDQASRDRAAADLEKLAAQLGNIGSVAQQGLRQQRGKEAEVLARLDFVRLVANLNEMAAWLRHPTPESTRDVETFVAQLRAMVDFSDAQEAAARDAQQSAEIKATVKASLDEIFSKPVPKPF